jgi:regulator of cell morphogenesis and NO signaling
MTAVQTMTIGEIVASDYRAASAFSEFGIDFCCGGKRTVEEACTARRVDPAAVIAAVNRATATATATGPAAGDDAWEPAALVDHIVTRHHAYVRAAVPRIAGYLAKLAAVHGERHRELFRVADRFAAIGHDLQAHMYKEEQILFPYVRALADAALSGAPMPPNMFGTVRNPIRMMELEHAAAGGELETIRQLTGEFSVPDDGCATYQVCYDELRAFDADLRRHIHLENNVLFPRAAMLEAALDGARDDRGTVACS